MKVKVFISLLVILFSVYPSNAILRGDHAWEDEVYFLVTLYNQERGNLTCGGVILDHEWVLTAASCAQHPEGMWAVAGSYFPSTISSTRWQRPIIDYGITHEKYVLGEPHYDIALLHVNQSYIWTEHVRPVVLPKPGENPSGEVNLFGHGQVTIGYPTTSLASGATRLTVNILPWEECRNQVPQTLIMDERMVCTQQIARQSFCKEDRGGPLVINRGKDLSLLVGIASWSYLPCGFENYPNVYTQVSLYLDWIQKNMKVSQPYAFV